MDAVTPAPPTPSPLALVIARVWPGPSATASRQALLAVTGVVAVAAIALVPNRPGLGWSLVGIAFMACTLVLARPLRVETIAWCAGAIALLSVGTIRSSGLLFTWCVIGAFACGSLALAGGRTVRALGAGALLVMPASLRGLSWWFRGVRELGRGRPSSARLGWTIAAMVALIAVFGALFVSADPVFADVLRSATSDFDTPDGWRAFFVIIGVTPLAVGAAYLACARPKLDRVKPLRTKSVRRLEWALPLGALDLLFLGFVVVQVQFLFGGDDRVRFTAGLTYADYARSGFWQLLAVAALTLAVIGTALAIAPKQTRADRVTLRALLGGLASLTLVIVASALQRMAIYDDAYGYTRLRLAVSVIELWLGAVFLLLLVAGARLQATWLPRGAVALAVVALLAVSYANPDGFIASHDVDRYQRIGRIDLDYLAGLSPDAASALSRLPEPMRGQALYRMRALIGGVNDNWRSWNLGRQRLAE